MTRFPTAGHLVSWARYPPSPAVRRQEQTHQHRQGQPLARRHPWRGRHRRRPEQDLPGVPLPPARPAPRQTTRPGRGRQLTAGHRLAPAGRPRSPLHRPRPRLARPARPDPPQAPAHRRTGTALRKEGHPPGRCRPTRPSHTRHLEPGSAALRRVLSRAHLGTDFRFSLRMFGVDGFEGGCVAVPPWRGRSAPDCRC